MAITFGQTYDQDKSGNAFMKWSAFMIRIINDIVKCVLLNT